MGCARIALERCGLPVEKYYASEVDPHAMKIVKRNWPDTAFVGGVESLSGSVLPEIDLLVGGPPCQDLSCASHTKTGLQGDRSGLFYEFARLLKEVAPRWWIMENVQSMKRHDRNIINRTLGLPPLEMNSSLFSAQNRRRLYWTNIPLDLFMDMPQDRMLVLRDILEDESWTERQKSHAIDAGYFKSGDIETYIVKHRRQLVFKDRLAFQIAVARCRGYDICRRVFSRDFCSPAVVTGTSGGSIAKVPWLGNSKLWRMLTPLECERLQTVPDNYTKGVSSTQRYKMLGNGFTVDVVAHFLRRLQGRVQ